MCSLYVLCSLLILLNHAGQVPTALGKIFGEALAPESIYGGFIGVLVMGFQRAAFSNEAGVGSAAIAHSAAKTKYPVREGIVALLEPFIDTVVVCTMTALVIVVTGAYNDPATEIARNPDTGTDGAALTAMAWGKSFLGEFGQWVLLVAVLLFAYSTLISWSYYGERCWVKLFGIRSSILFKLLFLVFVVLGSIISAKKVLDFGDLMILLMAFPNILGLYFLQGEVAKELRDYELLKNAGKFKVFK
jgi:AGCS family alanine or glycine:cation symporter